MAQAAALDGQLLDFFPFCEDGLAAAEVDIGRRQVAQALVVAVVVVVVDEGADGELELAWEKVVLEQDAVLQRLVPALDLARPPRASDRWRPSWRTWGWLGDPRT
jgi:hypothetical protein